MAVTDNLPDVEFAERDATTIEAEIVTTAEGLLGRTLYASDPLRLFLQGLAAVISQQRAVIDHAGKMNLLSYATGEFLDALGELVLGPDNGRQDPQSALTTIEFTLSEAQADATTIPAGTEVAAGDLVFATTEGVDIAAGDLTGSASAACQTAGTVGNGLLPGQVKTLVEPVPFVDSAVNTTSTTGGAAEEDDEAFRERIRLAPASFSVAGPEGAYVFWARSANQAIIDVSVIGPPSEPGNVYVRPLLTGGMLPDQDVLDQVDAVLSDDQVRPLTDNVLVQAPTAASYAIDFDYWVNSRDVAQAATIQDRVDEAVEAYRLWQRGAIGRDVNPDELVQRVKAAGAKRVVLRSPSFTVLDDTQVAQESSVTALYQGVEDA